MLLDLQKICKDSTENSHTPTQFLLLEASYFSIVYLSKLMNHFCSTIIN